VKFLNKTDAVYCNCDHNSFILPKIVLAVFLQGAYDRKPLHGVLHDTDARERA
jgi:hypothetical protein